MKKNLTKVVMGTFLAVLLISGNGTNVNAYSVTNGGKGFSKPWELSVTSDSGKGILTYGFNTVAINEDYAYAYHSSKKHYAYIKNGSGSHSGYNKAKKKWSKIEVTHSGKTIKYGNSY